MRIHRIGWTVLLLGCGTALPAEDDLKETVRGKVQEINDATIKGDFGKVVDLTYPKVVEMAGGREKMVSLLESGIKEMKSKGYEFRAVKTEPPSDPVKSGPNVFVVVPFMLEMKAPGGKLFKKSFVIGVSGDSGKTWRFINGDLDVNKVRQVLPGLPDQLKLPEKQKPVFEKD